jgi:hypothetical protein
MTTTTITISDNLIIYIIYIKILSDYKKMKTRTYAYKLNISSIHTHIYIFTHTHNLNKMTKLLFYDNKSELFYLLFLITNKKKNKKLKIYNLLTLS